MNTYSYLVEQFNYRRKPQDLESYLAGTVLPYLAGQGLKARLFSTAYGLSGRHFWMISRLDEAPGKLPDSIFEVNAAGREILARLQEETTGHRCLIWHDPEPEITWEPDRRYPMWHCETFHAHHNAGEVRRFFLNTALPYLRQRGFYLKFFYNLSHLGPSRFWFITGMENFSMLDRWETMASGEPEGAQIMGRLLELIDLPRAAVLREIT